LSTIRINVFIQYKAFVLCENVVIFLLTKMKCASAFSAQATVRIDMIFKLSATEVTVKIIGILVFFTLGLNCVSEELQLVSITQVMKAYGEN